jgi:hypothetical protein
MSDPATRSFDGARCKDLPCIRQGCYTSAYDDCDTRHLACGDFTLARVDARTHFDPERPHALDDRLSAADGMSRAVERREEPVAGSVDLFPAVVGQLAPDERVVALQEVGPGTVAKLRPTRG